MRSVASFKSHPLHPALIPFPFAFLTGAFLFDVAGVIAGRPTWWTTGSHLAIAGVAAALVAAVPGTVDYVRSVPPRSSGKQRATKHALANLAATGLFAAAWWLRGGADVPPSFALLAIEAVGVGLLFTGGWMGGTLVFRNQIGVDHRYAGAGRWNEERIRASVSRPVTVARADALAPNQMKLLHVDGQRIVLGRTDEAWVAFDDRCPHRGASLADGALMCGTVQCPWHGSQFDVITGGLREGPAEEGVRTYAVVEEDGEVRLVL
jgi:nitrite reductase/ring-hydroxylating ferredoxin subunit/uncharacterized membrane protein